MVSSEPIAPRDGDRDLVVPLVRGGDVCRDADARPRRCAEARAHHEQVRTALPPEAWALSRGEPVLETA